VACPRILAGGVSKPLTYRDEVLVHHHQHDVADVRSARLQLLLDRPVDWSWSAASWTTQKEAPSRIPSQIDLLDYPPRDVRADRLGRRQYPNRRRHLSHRVQEQARCSDETFPAVELRADDLGMLRELGARVPPVALTRRVEQRITGGGDPATDDDAIW